nr:hypothetical protein [Tanacetum cinerariifolium]
SLPSLPPSTESEVFLGMLVSIEDLSKIFLRHVEKELPKTEKSSMNTSMVCSIISWKIAIIHRWNMPGALQSPKGMRLYAKVLYGQVNMVISWSFGSMGT